MPNNKLGIRQRRMLADLATHGQGRWPEGWKQYHIHRETLETLVRRGLVTSACEKTVLTDAGWAQAQVFVTPPRLAPAAPVAVPARTQPPVAPAPRTRPQWQRLF